ncbi:PAS domain S-box protein [Halomicroarcula sp. S1AR25-4]|uniref:PAS domain S-box protein n=1 Tax=Haloarcula sp. S1AR25-4 TaxID=2950538 RepID=UPI002875DA02|nr:PAS domain S-box protein [Halomicroarcula sp. S1AR25-4]MDS0278978.1 PAS domain S-box protein [Halomicroarcula sp. S1AR25-4]
MTRTRETTVLLVSPPSWPGLVTAFDGDPSVTVSDVDSVEAALTTHGDAVDCVVCTADLPGGGWQDLLASVEETPFVLVALDGSEGLAADAVAAGADRYVPADDPKTASAEAASAVDALLDATGPAGHHEKLVEYSTDVIATYDRDGRLSYVSESVADTLGYEPEEMLGANPLEKVHPDDRGRIVDFFGRLQEQPNETRRATYRFETADGSYRTLESIGRNRFDDPALEAIVINSRDVTEREERKAELELRESIIEVAPIGLHVLDEEGVFLWVNDAFADVVGRDAEAIVGTEYLRLIEAGTIPPDIGPWYDESVRRLLSSKTDVETARRDAVPVTDADGETRLFDVHLSLLPLDDGEFAGTVAAFREVTERKEYEAELERRNERLTEFASVLSHDLRNPLSVATGRLELAQDRLGTDSDLTAAQTALDRIDALVENMLTLAREGRVLGELTEVDLSQVARAAWLTTETRAATVEIAPEVGTTEADETRLRQLFENLYRNSVEHGGTDVTVTVGSLPDGFYVADDGSGIPDDGEGDLLPGEDGGFGLGIVRAIATAHGWDMDVTASEAEGARFEFTGVGSE